MLRIGLSVRFRPFTPKTPKRGVKMRVVQVNQGQGIKIEVYGSVRASVVPLLKHPAVSVVVIYLEPGGVLGNHPAAADQLFLVVAGGGQASAGGQWHDLQPGTAVLWQMGEEHETRAGAAGLTAIVVEGEDLAGAPAFQHGA
jgi:quercetin dioxygenase-like cupin family protein